MSIRQHYYTSYVNKTSGSAGFQIKAMSPGISADEQALIAHMIAYRVPPTADEYQLEQHPIAMRYYYKDAQVSVLVSSQSNGKDENGRPGNFFAHSLIMPPDIFTSVPPVFFWKSPFWQKSDPSARTELPTLADLDIEPTLDIEQVWSFLHSEQRHLYALMCAVVQMERTQRRIVIIDSDEHVALWVAAISCLLPPAFRPLLSFATYHHDPYQAQFMITGTTPDSQFRASRDEYLSYFVLNMQTGEVSSVEDSEYARLVASVTNEDEYNDVLLPFFAEYAPRFASTAINQQLDLMARYYRLRMHQKSSSFDAVDLQAIDAVITHFAQRPTLTPEDIEEINQLGTSLSQAYITKQGTPDSAVSKLYYRFMVFLKERNIPNEELLLQEIKHVTERTLNGHAQGKEKTAMGELIKRYGEDAVQKIVGQESYLRWLARLAASANAQQLQRLWLSVGPYLTPSAQSAAFLQRSLLVANELSRQGYRDDLEELLQVIRSAIGTQARAWLSLAIELRNDPANPQAEKIDAGLKSFYYALVSLQPDLQARSELRALIWKIHPDIFVHELKADLTGCSISDSLVVLNKWTRYTQSYKIPVHHLIDSGLEYIRVSNSLAKEQWRELIPSILSSEIVNVLSKRAEQELVDEMMNNLSISQFSREHIELYQQYRQFQSLPDETRTILSAMIAMEDGQLDDKLVKGLNAYLLHLENPQVYRVEVDAFMGAIFSFPFDVRIHNLMVYATFVQTQQLFFWQVYQKHLQTLLTSSSEAKRAVKVISFWFQKTPRDYNIPYICQYFFFSLTTMLETTPQSQLQPFLSLAHKEPWYPLLKEYLAQKKIFAAAGHAVASQFQRLLSIRLGDKQKADQQATDYSGRIRDLFHEKKLIAHHMKDVMQLYMEMPREHFWQAYWESFMNALLSLHADQSLQLLTFWFDQSFEVFLAKPAISQEFFLGLPQVLNNLYNDHHFHAAAQRIDARGPQTSHWYPLIRPYLPL